MEYIVVLVAALFHAIWNGIMKESADRLLSLAAIRAVGLLFGSVVIVVFPAPPLAALPYLLWGVFFLFLYYWFLLNTYRVGDFSQVYPISRGGAPLLVLLAGITVARETISLPQIGAVVLISAGILALAATKKKIDPQPALYALGTACCIAAYTVVNGLGARKAGSFLVYAGWMEALCGLSVVIFTGLTRRQKAIDYARTEWRKGAAAGVLSVCGFLAVLWAMTRAPIAPVTALRETSIIFAAIIGAFRFKEDFAGYRILAASAVVAGITILVYFT